MKKIIIITIISVVTILSIFTIILSKNNKKLKTELSVSKANEKAHIAENNRLQNNNIQYQYTIDQLNYYNDSILIKLNNTRRELKIKDKEIKNLQYLLSTASKRDSIYIRDTIFKDKDFNLDTLMKDDWYKLNLHLQHPNLIVTQFSLRSEKHIITSYREETIDPPSNCFFIRWFQKKHKVVEVIVEEKCPYIKNNEQKFIEIIK